MQGRASACVFRHPLSKISTSVYGGDFLTTGPKIGFDWFADLDVAAEMRK